MRNMRKLYLMAFAILVALLTTPVANITPISKAAPQGQRLSPVPDEIPLVTEFSGSTLNCRNATRGEAQSLKAQATVQRHAITPSSHVNNGGLTIILRGTPQLESFPTAKAA